MTNSINSISIAGAASTASSSSAAQKLTDETKNKLQALGVDTTNITTETQGQIALLQAQQAKGEKSGHGGAGKEEMQSLKAEATSLAEKLGVSVTSDEKLSEIMDAIGPALDAKISAAGNDEAKIAETQSLQDEFAAISSTLSDMQAQKQAAHAQITGSLAGMAQDNKIYHKIQ